MNRIEIIQEYCIGCGVCASVCPDVFEMNDDSIAVVIDGANCKSAGCCEEA